MPRIVGVDVPNDKRIVVGITYIFGVGPFSATQILKEAQINSDARGRELSEDEISRIAGVLDRSYVIEGQLRRQISQNIARLRDIGCYRGIRHRRGLPVRGQNTQSNARTRKGPKKTVAGKKSIKGRH